MPRLTGSGHRLAWLAVRAKELEVAGGAPGRTRALNASQRKLEMAEDDFAVLPGVGKYFQPADLDGPENAVNKWLILSSGGDGARRAGGAYPFVTVPTGCRGPGRRSDDSSRRDGVPRADANLSDTDKRFIHQQYS